MTSKNFFFLFVLSAFLFVSGSVNSQISKVKTMTQIEFKRDYDKLKKAQILDVRTADEVKAGKISGAAELDFFDPNFKKKIEAMNFNKSKPMIVYCAVGGRSSKAAAILTDLGFKTVYNLEGGYTAYQR